MRRDVGSLIRYVRRLTPPADGDSDGLLLGRFVEGDESAFSALLQRHAALVWGVCVRTLPMDHDAEDAFQAVFVVLARKAGGLRHAEPLAPWLHRVAWRTAQKARSRRSVCAPVEDRPAAMDPSTGMRSRELRGLIDEEIDRLPERYRRPVLLCLVEGLTNEEAASRLACPVGTVQSRLSRARDRLRRALVRRGVESPAALVVLAAPAVPVRLLESSLPSIASSTAVSALAKGVLFAMTLKRFEVVLVLLVFTLAGSGAWLGTRPGTSPSAVAQAVKPEGKEAGKPPEPPKTPELPKSVEKKPAVVRRADTLSTISKALAARVEYTGVDGPETKLGEELERIQVVYGLQFDVNERAFENNVLETLIAKPTPIPPMRTSLAQVLRRVLGRVESASPLTYLIRQDCIEITTEQAVRVELGLPVARPNERLLPLVSESFDSRSVREVLRRMSETSGYNVLLDPRAETAGEKKMPLANVTLDLRNVPVDVAVDLIAEMVGLEVVRRANVFFVTTNETAERMRNRSSTGRGATPLGGGTLGDVTGAIPGGPRGTPPPTK